MLSSSFSFIIRSNALCAEGSEKDGVANSVRALDICLQNRLPMALPPLVAYWKVRFHHLHCHFVSPYVSVQVWHGD